MRIFQEKIYDNLVSGTTNVYTGTELSELLGSVDRVTLFAYVLGVTGTGPTITMQLENSPDRTRWQNQNSTPEINGSSLGSGDNFIQTNTVAGVPMAGHVRLRIALGGTSPVAVVRIWAFGTGPNS